MVSMWMSLHISYHSYLDSMSDILFLYDLMQSIETNKLYKEQKKIDKALAKKARILSKAKTLKSTPKDKAVGKVPKAKKYTPTGEAKMFEEIRNERPHICKVCTRHIKEARTRCFAHIFSKKMFPKYRLIKANIALVCSQECHNKLDTMMMSFKKDRNNMLYFDTIIKCIKK